MRRRRRRRRRGKCSSIAPRRDSTRDVRADESERGGGGGAGRSTASRTRAGESRRLKACVRRGGGMEEKGVSKKTKHAHALSLSLFHAGACCQRTDERVTHARHGP